MTNNNLHWHYGSPEQAYHAACLQHDTQKSKSEISMLLMKAT